ncbi:DUF1801 domain-containing protein [bacterium]|nr:DUF1801 domain-containing protein [bacterium]
MPPKGNRTSRPRSSQKTEQPRLLAGGNPQIPKGDGDQPVQAYIHAMPGWKREAGHKLDELITQTVSQVRKAVRWNSPFYGTEEYGWFMNMHCLTKYIKVAFFNGTLLKPLPPIESRKEGVRYFHIFEGEQLDEELLKSWIQQAASQQGVHWF